MKTVIAYILGFSVTFTVIAGGMYVLSRDYPWMFGTTQAHDKNDRQLKATVSLPSGLPGDAATYSPGDSARGEDEVLRTLKEMLAAKNDSISAKNEAIQHLDSTVTQLHRQNSDANSVIAQLQNQVDSWNNQRRKDIAAAYNDMDPGAAAKIMKNLDDRDIIFILSSIQKKQAAQILGQLDPVRAAKLMTNLGHGK
ncbi:MAG: hypothetical protein M1395_09540 [Bacteroidetes bacterium]|jgi:flagellar motility protein MotE (MotC chaperone)|nr:hypothetical protein [Bacteroidota bacterium]